jgi:hypothetical protein
MRQPLVYGFGPEARFEGQLVGALERIESGGALRVVDALFVRRDAESGELSALDVQGRSATAAVGRLLEFRFDDAARRRSTERALHDDTVRAVADRLGPGRAVLAVLVEHAWADVLDDAVARTGGAAVRDELVDAEALADVLGAGIAG